jgi:hypothetical protein
LAEQVEIVRRYVIDGAAALAGIVASLSLERFVASGMSLQRVEVLGDEVRVFVLWPGVGEAAVCVAPPDGRPCFCGHPHASVMLIGASVSKPWALLMRRVASALGGGGVAGLIELLRPWMPVALDEHVEAPVGDEQPGPDGQRPGPDAAESDPGPRYEFTSPINQWGEDPPGRVPDPFPRTERDFLCDHAMRRKIYDSVRFDGPEAAVVHGDLECSFITPHSRAPLARFFNYPWPLKSGDDEGGVHGGGDNTLLGDLDVINGGGDKLEAAVRGRIVSARGRCPVTVFSTCVPTIIGDDVDGIVARCRDSSPHGVYHVSPRTVKTIDVSLPYVEAARDLFLADGGRPVPGTVGLVGFLDDRARAELAAILAEAGIPLAGCIVPLMGPGRMVEVLKAELLVFRPSVIHQDLCDRLFAGVDRARIAPPAPWGWAATRAWVLEVARQVGRGEAAAAVLDARMEVLDRRRRGLEEQAAGHALAFVLDAGQEERILDPASQTGLPILAMVRELGFPVRILVYAGREAAWAKSRERLAAAAHGGVEVHPFRTPDEMEALLGPPVRAAFTEFFFDHRLSRRGLAQFSARDFEIGLEGALRSLDRLVRVASTPFYRTYAAHLARGAS